MPFFSHGMSWNVTTKDIPAITLAGPGSDFEITNGVPTRGHVSASPGSALALQFRLEKATVGGVTVEIHVTDPSGEQRFVGQAMVTWPDDESDPVQVEFRDFRSAGRSSAPTDCDFEISVTNDEGTSRVGVKATAFPASTRPAWQM